MVSCLQLGGSVLWIFGAYIVDHMAYRSVIKIYTASLTLKQFRIDRDRGKAT
jgi:hypothetical protein